MPDQKRSPMEINPHRSPMDIHNDQFPEPSAPLPENTGVDEAYEDASNVESAESVSEVSKEEPVEKKKAKAQVRNEKS